MTMKRNLVGLLAELDVERAENGMPLGARNRVLLAIRGHEAARQRSRRRWMPALSFAAGAALVFGAVGWRVASTPNTVASSVGATDPSRTLGGFRIEAPCVRQALSGTVTALASSCRMSSKDMRVSIWEPSELIVNSRTVEVRKGKVFFDVEHVEDGESPIEVTVSHGTIEVVGTRFAVEQNAVGGHVDLLEGSIRFVQANGSVVDIAPGQRHAWGAEAEPEPDAIRIVDEPARPKLRRARVAQRSIDDVIARVTQLRASKRYGAAISELRRAMRRKWDRRTSEVLSYELGELLQANEDIEGACQHFRRHARRFPDGRYQQALATKTATCSQ